MNRWTTLVCAMAAGVTLHCDVSTDLTPGGDLGLQSSDAASARAQTKVVVSRESCALRNGRVWCWGGEYGSLPVLIRVTDAVDLAINYAEACVVHASGKLSCWSHAASGGRVEPMSLPVSFAAIDGSADAFCALGVNRRLYCFGSDDFGQLGTRTRGDRSDPDEPVTDLSDVTSFAVAPWSACAQTRDGQVLCWGRDAAVLSDQVQSCATPECSALPIVQPALAGAQQFSQWSYQGCALSEAGWAFCSQIEFKRYGERVSGRRLIDEPFGGRRASLVKSGYAGTCVQLEDELLCRSGSGSAWQAVRLPQRAVHLSVGEDRMCAVTEADEIYCWSASPTGSGVFGEPSKVGL